MDLECEGKAGVGIPELTWIHTHKTAALLKVGVALLTDPLAAVPAARWPPLS